MTAVTHLAFLSEFHCAGWDVDRVLQETRTSTAHYYVSSKTGDPTDVISLGDGVDDGVEGDGSRQIDLAEKNDAFVGAISQILVFLLDEGEQ